MFDLIARLMPDWLMPVIAGLGIWFGLNYFYIAPEIGHRTIANTCPSNRMEICTCISENLIEEAGLQLSLWTSSLGFYSIGKNKKINASIKTWTKICRQ